MARGYPVSAVTNICFDTYATLNIFHLTTFENIIETLSISCCIPKSSFIIRRQRHRFHHSGVVQLAIVAPNGGVHMATAFLKVRIAVAVPV